MNVSSVKNLNGEVLSAVQDATLTDVVQSNSAAWGQGGGAISSYTTTWSHEVPPYGDSVINTLNEKYISAFISNSADKSKFANNANSANSANYAETVNETYLENKGFTRNLSSEYGTISVIHNNIIESTNSAIVRTGNEGFVSSFEGQSIGPAGNGTATFSWDKSLPNTIINLDMSWSHNEILTYSANTNLTGEIVLPTGVNTQTIAIPNATEFKVWSNIWIGLNSATVSAADQFETVVGELAWTSALPTYEYDITNKISAINGSALAGGSSDTFYIYPGKTTDKEISENSGKYLKLYNSANNVFLDFAGKSTLSKYTMFSFKEITGTQANQNTVQHLRLRVYPNATSACKVFDNNTVNLLDSNSTVSTAQTAYYDAGGRDLAQTHDDLTALNAFVQSNSANWGGGSSPAGGSVLFHYNYSHDPNNGSQSINSYISGAKDLYFEASLYYEEGSPNDVIITRHGNEIGRASWSQVSGDIIGLQNNGFNYQCYVSANGLKTNAFEQRSYYCKTSDTIKINVQGSNVTGDIIGMNQYNGTTLTSFTGSLSNFTANGYDHYDANIFSEDSSQPYSYEVYAELVGGGSTVASGDVFPPTNNLDPNSTYYLGWNANNGGLFWYNPGNGGN